MQSNKSFPLVCIFCFVFGTWGLHRFYVGKFVTGILMALTLGGLGVWTLIDFIRIVTGNFKDNQGNVIRQSERTPPDQIPPTVNSVPSGSSTTSETLTQGKTNDVTKSKPAQYAVIGCLVVVIAAVALIVACVVSIMSVETSPYAGGRWSCDTFRSVQNDVTNGLLTIPEMREEVKKVQSRGSTAEPEIAAASTALLAFLTSAGFSPTQQDLDGILNASLAMTEACKKYEY